MYRILRDGVPNGRWNSRIEQPILGLKENEVTVFYHSHNGGGEYLYLIPCSGEDLMY